MVKNVMIKLNNPRHVRCRECGGEGTLTHVHPDRNTLAAVETEVDELYKKIHKSGCSRVNL